MISETYAAQQVARLDCTDYFSELTPNGLKELRLSVQAAKTEEIAERVVTDWIRYNRVRPTPADLREAIWTENDKLEQVKPIELPIPDPLAALERAARKLPYDVLADRQLTLLRLRTAEQKNPTLARWIADENGQVNQQETEVSRALRETTEQLRESGGGWFITCHCGRH